ncbi:Tuberous sclerosis 1 [Grifola frondosa]|uniref:Tuberous sclerosis 1 n=1 Tax=Grifola frondosa TaxID=5627 RepID=A0A1C7MF85_GRIFR|nr:Tuberous sclerosis 1 [Grifola frondosa]
MSALVNDLSKQLRLLLEGSPDTIPLDAVLAIVDSFVLECSAAPDSAALLALLEDELQAIYDDVIGHALPQQAEVFLAVLYHLRPILPCTSLISTWFDLVLRPALREPKLPTVAVHNAKELIISALDPGPYVDIIKESPDSEEAKERARQLDKMGDFRRRLMDLYLLDAYNESSGDDVLEWAELDQEQRDKKACWKANLEDVLVMIGLERPQDFLTELYHCFLPSSRLQLLILLNAYTSQPAFPANAHILAAHPLMMSLLYSLIFDNSSTRANTSSGSFLAYSLSSRGSFAGRRASRPSYIALNLTTKTQRLKSRGERLELTFDGPTSSAPSPHRYFTFLYYLFPCNTLRFLRYPVAYLNDSELETLFTVDWDEALDVDKIRSKSEPLLRGHVLHPLLIWRGPTEELSQPDFWARYDIGRIVSEATMLDVRNASLGSDAPSLVPNFVPPSSAEITATPTLPPDTTTSASAIVGRLRVSLQDMITTYVALKSGLDVDIVDPSPAWSSMLFPSPDTRSPSLEKHPDGDAGPEPAHDKEGVVPLHVAQAISALQREVLLLRSELNFELWTTRENVRHIGRLYEERVLSQTAEVERQGLHNKMREYKSEVLRLRKALTEHKEQATSVKNQYIDWNRKLQDMLTQLRKERETWTAGAAAMRVAEKEAKDSFAAQKKLLAEAVQRVFVLETKIKENAHKVDRLHDYEKQVDQLIKLQRLWELDVQRLNEDAEYLQAFTSKYRKMELQLQTYEQMHAEMQEYARDRQHEVQKLESQLALSHRQLETAQKTKALAEVSITETEYKALSQKNEKLRNENSDLREEVEEMKAMIEILKGQVSGRQGLVGERRGSPMPFGT